MYMALEMCLGVSTSVSSISRLRVGIAGSVRISHTVLGSEMKSGKAQFTPWLVQVAPSYGWNTVQVYRHRKTGVLLLIKVQI